MKLPFTLQNLGRGLVATALFHFCLSQANGQLTGNTLAEGPLRASITVQEKSGLQTYELTSNAELRDNTPPDKRITFSEVPDHARIRTGNPMFDGLYALAVSETLQNSVSRIKDHAYGNGAPIALDAFQTGEFWTYVWTRDLSYSVFLALGGFDPNRAASSLLFKTSTLKSSVTGGFTNQIVQDTGSGGSYPVSTDRIVWILGADATLKFLPEAGQKNFLSTIYPILHDTIEQDRKLIFDSQDGLYRGEESFLDWREQTYPGWTKDNVIAIAMSKSLSVNAANYFALRTASEYAEKLGRRDEQKRYASWATDLKISINRHFFDTETGLYAAYLLTDSTQGIRVHRYDLLGEALALLTGVADEAAAKSIIRHYPIGPYGPPVVWPQEHSVPIYHNQAIWPFVTAFWIEAAQKAGNAAAVDEGIHSLMRGAAFNLSNMENFDFVTGQPQVLSGPLKGPVINSRRQLWSVAAYLAMVQNTVFGLETSHDGIRFRPFVTDSLRNEVFPASDMLNLENFRYRDKMIHVHIHLPHAGTPAEGVCKIVKIELNGKRLNDGFVSDASLQSENQWDVYLKNSAKVAQVDTLNLITNLEDPSCLFGPLQPQWAKIGQGGITVEKGLLALHYEEPEPAKVHFNIYRDGRLCARDIGETHWTDPHSDDYTNLIHFYTVEAIDNSSGNASHLAPSHFYSTTNSQWSIPATAMEHSGGKLMDARYFADWGKSSDELRVNNFTPALSGHCAVRVEFSNGAGPLNTGITCAVKKLEIRDLDSDIPVASAYLVMPQSGDWKRFDLSSIVLADFKAGKHYSLRIFEDVNSRNMSYLTANARYTASSGGGTNDYNFVNLATIQFQRVAR